MTMTKPQQTVRIVQISDTHLSRTHAYFHENWRVLLDDLRGQNIDLIIHTGDVSFNGAHVESDIAYAREQMDNLQTRWLIIPGNHDIGEAPAFSRLDQHVDAHRVSRWERHFGSRWWSEDISGWRLVGLDTALMGSGSPDEHAQFAFLHDALSTRGERQAMVFTHMPPFVHDPHDAAFTTSCIPHPARLAFLDACAAASVKVIASGHLHIHHTTTYRDVQIVWAPTTAMVSIEKQLKRLGRVPRPGYLVWELGEQDAVATFVNPEMMFMLDVTSYTKRHGGSTTKLPPKSLA